MTDKLQTLRRDAKNIFKAGLQAIAPGEALRRFCRLDGVIFSVDNRQHNLDEFDQVIVLGAGKGAAAMAKEMESLLGKYIDEGLVVVKYDHVEKLSTIKIIEAGHPVPDENGHEGAKQILKLAEKADKRTLIICLISGGGSALIPLPVSGVSLEDKQETTKVLLACGATIHEINSIRKHLSRIKGGGLAKAAYPATLITLILSDVVGDDLDSIASGPSVPDSRTFQECLTILDRYKIKSRVPESVLSHIEKGVRGEVEETPEQGNIIFKKTSNVIIGSNYDALNAAKKQAVNQGYNTLLLSSLIEGETRDFAAVKMAIAKEISLHGEPVSRPACLLSGGETTVTIQGSGKGGRNQEFVLAAALKMENIDNCVTLSAGTDGTDGPTDAAGAISDSTTLQRAEEAGLVPMDYLLNNDSYTFFTSLQDLYRTGPTNTNVMDIRIMMLG